MKFLPVLSANCTCRTRPGTRAVFLAAFLFLAACSTLPDQSTPISTLASRQPAANFTAAGRVATRVTGDAKRGFSGGFAWTHRPAEDVVELLTPLGQIAARMTITSAGAEIELSDGRRTFTSDPEQFLSDAFGVTLPVAALPYWLQAVPLAWVPFRAEGDAIGRPVSLWQNGWQIQYTAYADETAGAYPIRMQLTQGDIEARMIISEWSPK
jgi:outer membrane lipoprotein LolB